MPDRTATNDAAQIEWRADGAPRSARFGDIYFSPADGLAESRHVFLDGNSLADRFSNASRIAVGELGFGSGLNFLACWELWRRTRKPGARLDFISVEGFPMAPDDMRRALAPFAEIEALARRLCGRYDGPAPGIHRYDFSEDGVYLTLAIGEAGAVLPDISAQIDAWFLDGFAPSKNPEMWRDDVLAQVARLSRPGATAATFSVAGAVRRGLDGCGFRTEKRPGFGAKRDMLCARLNHPPASRMEGSQPWFAPPRVIAAPGAKVAVIGAGVAGASAAYALHAAGMRPIVFERARSLGAGASGNPAALVMPWLDAGAGPVSEFQCAAFGYATRLYRELDAGGDGLFDPCGALWIAKDAHERARFEKIADDGNFLPRGALAFLQPQQASETAGADCPHGGMLIADAGTVAPTRLLPALLRDIEIEFGVHVAAIEKRGGRWRASSESGAALGEFDAVIVADGAAAAQFAQTRHLPLAGSLGQITYADQAPNRPDLAIAFGPYIAPYGARGLVLGATYAQAPLDHGPVPARDARRRENLTRIGKLFPTLLEQDVPWRDRASLRAATPDRAPIIGPAPDATYYLDAYAGLRKGVRADYSSANYHDGLFVLTGLGSRGFVTAPLGGALVAAQIAGLPTPLRTPLLARLHPGRFLIRGLKRDQALTV